MINAEAALDLLRSMPDAHESPHFEKTSFRIKKRIFATLDVQKQRVVVKLSEMQQSLFCAFDTTVVYPVAGGWGKQGWTVVELQHVPEETFHDLVHTAYTEVSGKK